MMEDKTGVKYDGEYRDESVPEILAEMTGREAEEFKADSGYEHPDLDDLESVPEDER